VFCLLVQFRRIVAVLKEVGGGCVALPMFYDSFQRSVEIYSNGGVWVVDAAPVVLWFVRFWCSYASYIMGVSFSSTDSFGGCRWFVPKFWSCSSVKFCVFCLCCTVPYCCVVCFMFYVSVVCLEVGWIQA
jgi:hypothetical protein